MSEHDSVTEDTAGQSDGEIPEDDGLNSEPLVDWLRSDASRALLSKPDGQSAKTGSSRGQNSSRDDNDPPARQSPRIDLVLPRSQSTPRDNTDPPPLRQSPDRDDTIIHELKRLSSSVSRIVHRVECLESSRTTAPPQKKRRAATESRILSWADQMDGDEAKEDSDEEYPDKTSPITLSESNKSLLATSFSTTLSNSERRKVRNTFQTPGVVETRCPRLDPIFKSTSVKAEVKSADSELARLQAFVHDPVGPLTMVLHSMEDPQSSDEYTISVEEARDAVSGAIKLLGNASSQISRLRRKKILKAVNPSIQDLAEEDLFSGSAPNLFGSGFERKMKDRAKSMKLIASASKPPPGPKKFFRGGRPTAPQRGGGQARRGGRQQGWNKQSKTTK